MPNKNNKVHWETSAEYYARNPEEKKAVTAAGNAQRFRSVKRIKGLAPLSEQPAEVQAGTAPRKYWSESGSLISKEAWEAEQAAKFPAFARDLAKRAAGKLPLFYCSAWSSFMANCWPRLKCRSTSPGKNCARKPTTKAKRALVEIEARKAQRSLFEGTGNFDGFGSSSDADSGL